MLSDERYKQLMEAVGMPNSNSLLSALYQCATEATLIERAAWIKKEQLLQEKINSLQEQSQITYEKYEFCRSLNCPEIADKHIVMSFYMIVCSQPNDFINGSSAITSK